MSNNSNKSKYRNYNYYINNRNNFSTAALINLYHAFIFPYLIYCVEVWGNALSKHVQPLIKLQNKILKITTPSHRFINKEQLYAHSGILHSIYYSRQANHFRSRRGNIEFVYKTFAFQSVFIWNKIIQNIDINVHITRFKHLLKEFLLSNDISFRYTK